MSFAALQAAWAGWLLDGLIAAGVERAVVSPGSRSTPVVLAIARAEAAGRLQVDVVIDERVAGFLALGHARATGRPSLLVCTSGTAGAHYLPAVVEAAEARLPLIVLTADRPPELQGRGASQTVDQQRMFGHFARRAVMVGPAESDPRAVDGLLRTAVLAVHAARWPDPGPVHIDAAFRKPLEPDGTDGADVDELARRAASALASGLAPPALPRAVPDPDRLSSIVTRARGSRRGIIVVGPCAPREAPSPRALEALVEATGFPVVAEAASQRRFRGALTAHLDAYEPLFGSTRFLARGSPDFVVQIGSAPTGRSLGRWIADSGVERIVLARHGVPEAFNQASDILIADLEPAVTSLADRIGEIGAPDLDVDWLASVESACARARGLAAETAGPGSQGEAVRASVDALPDGGVLVLGNSMPVRDVDLYCPAADRGLDVLSQRGAAGIDGLIAGAAGAAAASGWPTVLLLGDVSFQHDVGGLAVAATSRIPLVVVVVQNGGGRLFELLPIHDLAETRSTFDRYFLTPPVLDVTGAAEAFGVAAATTRGGDELREALAAGLSRSGPTVVEAVVDPDGAHALRRVVSALDAWIDGPEGCFPA